MPVLREGTSLKHDTFIIIRQLGRGGKGEVYLARQPRMGRDVAIKVLSGMAAQDPQALARFQREALAAASLSHPNVLAVHDFDFDDGAGAWFLAMQYIPGGHSLAQRLGKALELEEVTRIVAGVADALDAAHARGIVHRDVKPDNILLDGERPLLSDFGIAHLASMEGITAAGYSVGTPLYMSPEQWSGKPVGAQSDQYSLAIVAYELLAGRAPFDGEPVALAVHHLKTPPPRLRATNPSIPAAVEAVLLKAMSKQPEARFRSCGEFAGALAAATAVTEPLR